MAKQLFETTNRDESHRVLEYVLGQREKDGVDPQWPGAEKFAKLAGKHPRASCRENPAAEKYSVWDETVWERSDDYEQQQVKAGERAKQIEQAQATGDPRIEALMHMVGSLHETTLELKNAIKKKPARKRT